MSPLDQEVILMLREEYDQAKARAATENERIEAIQQELSEAISDHVYWHTRAQALETLISQESPTPLGGDRFRTFGDPGPVPEPPAGLFGEGGDQ